MHRTSCALLLLALALDADGRVYADDQADARAIIDKGIAAAGGKDKLAKFNAQTWKEKGTYYGMGQGQPYTGRYAMHIPDKFRMEIENVFILVVDGDKGWLKSQDNTQEMTKEQIATQKEHLYGGWVSTLLPLQDKEFTLATLPEMPVNNRPAAGVRVSRKGHQNVDLYFDKESGLLIKSEQRIHSDEEKGKEVNQEAFFSDHKEIEGVKMPMKLVLMRDGKQYIEAQHYDLKPLDKLDDKVFAKP